MTRPKQLELPFENGNINNADLVDLKYKPVVAPVKYKVNDSNNKSGYEVNSQNAYYNIETKSVIFSSNKEGVRSKIYF